jgi:hypothetical protein
VGDEVRSEARGVGDGESRRRGDGVKSLQDGAAAL